MSHCWPMKKVRKMKSFKQWFAHMKISVCDSHLWCPNSTTTMYNSESIIPLSWPWFLRLQVLTAWPPNLRESERDFPFRQTLPISQVWDVPVEVSAEVWPFCDINRCRLCRFSRRVASTLPVWEPACKNQCRSAYLKIPEDYRKSFSCPFLFFLLLFD